MWQFDESAAQFPPQRAEEPENLRREIVEELKDHLTCARRREQMAGGEQAEEAVRRRVLERFGDPAAVARKLWLDWMWERIMSQRILVATCVLMVAISCVALGLAWASLKGQQDMMATWQSTSETQMRDQQILFERLLAQSEKALTQGSAKSQPSIEWNPVELKFVSGKKDGPPLSGVQIYLNHRAEDSGIPSMGGKSDEHGIVRFERVHYGDYRLRVETPWQESLSTSITQRPGESLSQTVVCPEKPGGPSQVLPRIEWPDELAGKPLWFRFQQNAVYRPLAEHSWRGPPLLPGDYMQSLLIEPSGTVHGMRQHQDARPVSRWVGRPSRGGRGAVAELADLRLPIIDWNHAVNDFPNGITWLDRSYEIRELEVLVPIPEVATMDDLRREAVREDNSTFRSSRHALAEGKLFVAIDLHSAGWPRRIEPGKSDQPGTLWLTPNDEQVNEVRAALGKISQAYEAAKKGRAELEERTRGRSGAAKETKDDSK
jgi:hypothetical protein